MKIQFGTGGSATQAAALQDISFRPCGGASEYITHLDAPAGSVTDRFTVVKFTADKEQSKDGSRRVWLQTKVKFPMMQVNTNGTTAITTPEIQAHLVVRVPASVAKALEGAMTVVTDDLGTGPKPSDQARVALAQALTFLVTVVTNQPANWTYLEADMASGPVFYGLIGSCPMDYVNGDYGTRRVLPPPART